MIESSIRTKRDRARLLTLVAGLATLIAFLESGPAPMATTAFAAPSTAAPADTDTTLASYDGGAVKRSEFIQSWRLLIPTARPPGSDLESRQAFLESILNRKLLAREANRMRFHLTESESLEIQRMRNALIQNALFDRLTAGMPEPTPEEVERFARQRSTLAEIRFVTFADWDRARSWKQRLSTGTPLSALDAAMAREGAALAEADSFRLVAAEQIPDTLAQVIWSLRPGQVSAIHAFTGRPTVILVRRFEARPGAPKLEDMANLKMEVQRRKLDLFRERFRTDLAAQAHRTFDDHGLDVLLAAHLKVPPRSDVDSLSGAPTMRPNLGLPVLDAADTMLVVARVGGRPVSIGEYLRYWGRIQPLARPEIRERAVLEAAVDRVALAPEIVRVARERGLADTPAIREELARMREGFALDHYFAQEIESKVRVPETAVRKMWAADPKHYNDRASIDSRIILVDHRSLADSLLARLRSGASFGDLAKEYSNEGQSGAQGGVVGKQYRGTQENAGLEDAMFATPVGGIGGPEQTPQGLVIWRIDAADPGIERTFAEARSMVERDYRIMESDRMLQRKLAALRAKAHAKVYKERVSPNLGFGGSWDQ
jgi:parvulin-like peptidyl-prolyl isomerase